MLDSDQVLLNLFQAYYDARKHKRNKLTQLAFELNYEENLFQLHDELIHWTYQIGQSLPWRWLPIWNLTSQLFANIYMDPFDKFIKYQCGCKYYGRYVDDFVIIHKDKSFLTSLMPQIHDRVQHFLHLELHPNKIYLQHYEKWVNILWAIIKPHRIYIRKRTIGNFKKKVEFLNEHKNTLNADKVISIINSYLWMCKHYRSMKIRKKVLRKLDSLYWEKFEVDDKTLICKQKRDEAWSTSCV